ncbi:MAG: putative metal-binding motif-containing protein [Sandaracinaceae bacterium]
MRRGGLCGLGFLLIACASGGGDLDAGGGRRDSTVVVDAGGVPCTAASECDDGDLCNGVETCAAGHCAPGIPVDCDDAIACTTDACASDGTCSHTADDAACTEPGAICDLATGCAVPPPCEADEDCDDGLYCNGAETCDPATGCRSGAAPSCDDMLTCTMDSCDGATDACVHAPNDVLCNNGLACDGQETCDPSVAGPGSGCVGGAPPDCDDMVACTADACTEPMGLCIHSGTDSDGDGHVAMGCLMGDDCDDARGNVHPGAPELCDGLDNDCSTMADDGPSMSCVLGSGPFGCTTACSTSGMQSCTASCTLGLCVAATETCNDCDDTGDGLIDEGLTCRRGTTSGCTTACMTAGTRTCNATCSGYSACVAAAEVCGNACDDDGNGVADDGCPPPNDACSGALTLSGATGTRSDPFDGSTATVTDCATSGGRDIWYRLTVPTRSVLYLDTFGSTFDTKISIRTACGGSVVQCEDDDCGLLQEQLVRDVAAGTYYIAVHAYSAGTTSGTVSLRWQLLTAGNGTATRFTTNGAYGGTTAGASVTSGTCGGTGPENLHYFTMCPSLSRTVTATTCSAASYDTVLYLRGGGDAAIACNDDTCGLQSTITGAVTGPGVYGVYVDGYGAGAGTYTVTVSGL